MHDITAIALTMGPACRQAAFAASHKMCIRYLKDENAHTQLMYLGGVSLCGSLVMALAQQQWTMPSTALQWLLLLLTGGKTDKDRLLRLPASHFVVASFHCACTSLEALFNNTCL